MTRDRLGKTTAASFCANLAVGAVHAAVCLTGSGVCIAVLLLGINLIEGRKVTMAKSRIVKTGEKIAEGVVDGYKKIEQGVVGGYKKIEQSVVQGYTKLEDKFVDQYLTRDGETVEEAKMRLKKQNEDK